MCSAVFLRIGDMGTTSTRAPGVKDGAAGGREWRRRGAGRRPGARARALPQARRARRPVRRARAPAAGLRCGRGCPASSRGRRCPCPGTSRMSTLCSAAILRTTGDERVWRSSSTVISDRGFSPPAARAGRARGGTGAAPPGRRRPTARCRRGPRGWARRRSGRRRRERPHRHGSRCGATRGRRSGDRRCAGPVEQAERRGRRSAAARLPPPRLRRRSRPRRC